MQLFSTNRNRLREALVFQAPEINPHAFVQRLLAQEQTVDVAYFGAAGASSRGPVTQRMYDFVESGAILRIDRRDADVLVRTRDFKRVGTG